MEAKYHWKNSLLTKNKNEFSQFPEINWLNPYTEDAYISERNTILSELNTAPLFKSTKPFTQHISKGCQICGEGKWSCLFITNKCNAGCFYCPVPQKSDELPSTQGFDFENPNDYASYVNHFGFKGVSFSGGEPLLYFERTLEFLKVLRRECNSDLYIWMYTNGILADKEKLQLLANENLNEIRFDIGATGFSLDRVKIAKGIIPVVTIEIPSVPEEKERIISMLPEMIEAGVTNLNLHHLRLTPHNAAKLIQRNYTILSAERPLVVESEMAALEIIRKAQNENLNIGINYCSFHYKNRFQKAGYRRLILEKLYSDSEITENGYIRIFNDHAIAYKSIKLSDRRIGADQKLVKIDGVDYFYSEITMLTQNDLSIDAENKIKELILREPETPPEDLLLFKIWQLEYIESGLRDY